VRNYAMDAEPCSTPPHEEICEFGGDTGDVCDDTSGCARCTTKLEKTCEVGGDTGYVFDDVAECKHHDNILLPSKVRN